ncbi:hypothetical protein IFM89_034457 [Coptis chinensis]|uniref:Ubiquitin-like domain-containing protein n=1 Tax=Coptis chinensis TaxID=261450 RepID=A0A835IZS1_9MAGN|nr:hypothetical protein IFM89_034457 [Coptis chinensis]
MSKTQDPLDIKFRLTDGSDIGPKTFTPATSVATLKESIIAQWPKEKDNGPRTVKDIKIISAGRILENNKTLGECRSPMCDIPGTVTTMHVVVQTPSTDKGGGARPNSDQHPIGRVVKYPSFPGGLNPLLWTY